MKGDGPTSLSDLKSGMHVYGDKDESADKEVIFITKPDWYDEKRFKRGQYFFVVHRYAVIFNFLIALMVGLTIDALTDALIFTGDTVGPKKARKRYIHTLDYLIRWHTGGDIFDPKSRAGAAVLKVRHFHHRVRTDMSKDPQPQQMDKSPVNEISENTQTTPSKPLPMNQYDMAIVQNGFVAPLLIQTRMIGVKATEEELEDYVYFWRVVGWCLGIRDEYNTCGLSKTVAFNIAHEVLETFIVPGLEHPNPIYTKLLDDFVKGMSAVVLGMNKAAIYKYIFPSIGLTPPKLKLSEWPYYISIAVTAWLEYYVPPCRWLINFNYKIAISIVLWLYSGSEKEAGCIWTRHKNTVVT